MIKHIIITGNGLDLSLNLKTSYSDFIDFVKFISESITKQAEKTNDSNKNNWSFDVNYKDIINNTFGVINNSDLPKYPKIFQMRDTFLKIFPSYESFKAVSKNVFAEYLNFLKEKNDVYETNWNNIEKAIEELSDAVSFLLENVSSEDIKDFIYNNNCVEIFKDKSNYLAFLFLSNNILPLENSLQNSDIKPLQNLNKQLIKELDYLILMLEFYFMYIQKYDFSIKYTEFLDFLKEIENKMFINFNYTNTLEEIDISSEVCIHHIHGKVRSDIKEKTNNMIFGIGDKERENINLNNIEYQKFYQRILKKTGSEYETYFCSRTTDRINVIVFGHSVNPFDKEIFENIFNLINFEKNNCKFIFMYYDEQSNREIIKNLSIIIGKNLLIQLTSEEKIVFIRSNDIASLKNTLLK